jgi:hypothetical protein
VPVSGSANTGLPVAAPPKSLPINVTAAPGQLGAQAPVVAPPAPQTGAPPAKSNTLKWVLLIVGGLIVLGGGCCTCAAVVGEMNKQNGSPPPAWQNEE